MKILDLSQRLPGPLATKIMLQFGASVTKIELHSRPDPFLVKDSKLTKIFSVWYKNINKGKKILSLSDEELTKLDFAQFDIVFSSPSKILKRLRGNAQFAQLKQVEIRAGRNKKYLHDLNALVMSPSFNFMKTELPHLPFAGILYGQHIALSATSKFFTKPTLSEGQSNIIKTYLSDIPENILNLFWSDELYDNKNRLALHNGLYPCYNIYKSSDGHIMALAAVESKFWKEFCSVFNLEFSEVDRFDESGKVRFAIQQKFDSLSGQYIQSLCEKSDICLSFLPN